MGSYGAADAIPIAYNVAKATMSLESSKQPIYQRSQSKVICIAPARKSPVPQSEAKDICTGDRI